MIPASIIIRIVYQASDDDDDDDAKAEHLHLQ